MNRTRRSVEQIVTKLREAEAMLAVGRTVAQVVQALGVSEQTFNRLRNQYGGMKLKKAVADLTLDNQILKEANDYLGEPHGGGRTRGGGAS